MIKLLEDKMGENLDYLTEYGNNFLEAWSMKKIINKLDSIKIKTSALWKIMSKEWQDKPQTGRKYMQKTYLIKDCYPKYTKNSENSTIRKQTAQIKNGPKTLKTPQ